ncbi:MAG: acyltransferase family protein, partial [Lachnospiraceae bacterium]|nr:acyltransferase family protein [Lachnospiraceae bacterium]
MEGRQRDVLPDVLKGFGIVMVVLGHCIQSGSGLAYLENACYFEDRWYQFIYSFHMPLFMIISGYYAWNSVQRAATPKDRKTMLRKKCIYLITPNVGWKVIEFVYLFSTYSYIY